MLKYYIRRSSGEDFQKVANPPADNVWIHGDSVDKNDLHLLSDTYGMNFNTLLDVLDTDELPRVERKDDELYVFVRTVSRGKHSQIITLPMLLAVKGNVFANVSIATVENHKLSSPSALTRDASPVSLLLGTFAAVVGEYQSHLTRTSRVIHDTGRRLRTHEVTNDDFIHFVTVENNLNEYRTNLNAMLVVALRLQETFKQNGEGEAVEDIVLYIRQLLVSVESLNQTITSIRNAYGTIANNVLNQRMKTLTALTVLIALPNVFYGMYGMNVILPFQHDEWAFAGVLGSSLFAVIAVIIVARKKGIF